MTELSYSRAVHVSSRCPMDSRVTGCQPPAGVTPFLRFGLPSPPGVVNMVMAPGSASGNHPCYVVCKCGLGCCVCGGRRVGVGAWGRGLLVMHHVRALFVGGGGCVWVKCPCGGSGPHPGCWVLGWCWCLRQVVWLSAAIVVVHCFALFWDTVCCVLSCAWQVLLCACGGSGVLCCVVRRAASGCETRTTSPGRSPSMCTTGCHSPCVWHTP